MTRARLLTAVLGLALAACQGGVRGPRPTLEETGPAAPQAVTPVAPPVAAAPPPVAAPVPPPRTRIEYFQISDG